jgi:hypothetical protein
MPSNTRTRSMLLVLLLPLIAAALAACGGGPDATLEGTPVSSLIGSPPPVLTTLPLNPTSAAILPSPTLPSDAQPNSGVIATAPSTSCAGAPAMRLAIGSTGRVTLTNGLGVNIRETAGITGTQITALPDGTEFQVTDGPQCADSMNWWKVTTADGTSGWAAEGDQSAYLLEPYP